MDAATRSDAILSTPQLKVLAVTAADGSVACSTLPVAIVSNGQSTDSVTELSPYERFDVIALGQSGRLAVRLQRKPANAATTLSAIVPVNEIESWLPHSSEMAGDHRQLRLSIAHRVMLVVSDDFLTQTRTAITRPPSSSDGTAVGPEESQLVLTSKSSSLPISITTTAPVRASGPLDFRRVLTDFTLAVALGGLLLASFFRDQNRDLSNARFELAVRRDEFEILYRPIINLRGGKLAGAAVDMRWRRRDGTVLQAHDFLPALIRSGFEPHLLRHILGKCQADLEAAYKLRPRMQLKVPLDHESLSQPGFAEHLKRGLAGTGLRPSQLVLTLHQIGESQQPEASRAAMHDLQKLGIQLEFRQSSGQTRFGENDGDPTASLIGIDERLVHALDSEVPGAREQAQLWIGNIVATCASQGIRTCGYRARTADAIRQLKALGVDEVEGSAIAPALQSGSFLALVARAGLDQPDAQGTDGFQGLRRTAQG